MRKKLRQIDAQCRNCGSQVWWIGGTKSRDRNGQMVLLEGRGKEMRRHRCNSAARAQVPKHLTHEQSQSARAPDTWKWLLRAGRRNYNLNYDCDRRELERLADRILSTGPG